jgi:2-dehydropantoate 2-reductase
MASIAVIGPGAIGATVAAWLAQDPTHEVTVCARSPLERLMIDSPSGPIEASPRILVRPDDATGPVDWIMVATKAYDSGAAAPWLEQLIGKGSHVAVLQNGIEHRERFAGLVDPARLVTCRPGTVGPGDRRHSSRADCAGAGYAAAHGDDPRAG